MAFLKNKKPIDRAMLKDWTEYLDTILKHKNLRNYNHLTPFQVFLAVGLFLEGFYGTIDISWEIKFIQKNVKLAHEHKKIDPILWQNWLKCIDEVLSVKDSRMYFYLFPKNN
ncbi:MAG: hypothetical protein JO129_03535 [Candidatus Dependentiae bacterium]|nr:hypothetical protein [Candidatus Dependentiae bacterium]